LPDILNALNFRTISNYVKYVSGPLGIAAKVRVGNGVEPKHDCAHNLRNYTSVVCKPVTEIIVNLNARAYTRRKCIMRPWSLRAAAPSGSLRGNRVQPGLWNFNANTWRNSKLTRKDLTPLPDTAGQLQVAELNGIESRIVPS